MIFDKFADFITKHAKLVVVIWVIVLIASVYPAMHASEHLSYDTSSMGTSNSESIVGSKMIAEHFGLSSDSSTSTQTDQQLILITYSADSVLATSETAMINLVASIEAIAEDSSIIDMIMPYGNYTNPDGSGARLFAVIYQYGTANKDTGNLRNEVSAAISSATGGNTAGISKYVAGNPAISYDASMAMSSDMARVDPLSILMILILVGLFFRSFVTSAAPPITIGVAFALVLCALFFLGQVFDIYYITGMLLLVSMLGAGCDYCIFILSRYREERRSGREHIDACREAIKWAGESVTTSGIAVMIGFGAMMICSFGLIKYMGMGLAVGIVFALLAALTLMSSLLVLLGDKLFWPSGADGPQLNKGYLKKFGELGARYFKSSTNFSIKHAKAIVVASILFTVPMAYVYATAENSYDMIGSMMTGESKDGLNLISEYAGGGSVMPNYAVIELTEPIGTIGFLGETGVGMLTSTSGFVSDMKPFMSKDDPSSLYIQEFKELSNNLVVDSKALNNVQSAYFGFDTGDKMKPFDLTWNSIRNILYLLTYFEEDRIDENTDVTVSLTYLAENAEQFGLDESAASLIAVIPIFTEEVRTALTAAGHSATTGDDMVAAIIDYQLYCNLGSVGGTKTADGTYEANYVKMSMSTKEMAMSNNSIETVKQFSTLVHTEDSQSGIVANTYIAGTAAVMVEISDQVGSEFMKIEAFAIILIIILLFFVMKSFLTPIRSVATIFMSVIWTVAITHLVFGGLMNDQVLWVLPIILLVICLGLGMDYDILLTTRIKEYRFNKGMTNDEAISQAVLHSGSVITICGLIMGGTFGTLMLSSTVMLQQMGFALCFAILVDALVVRTYIVPAAMHLMGEWNWKGPKFLGKNE